MKKYLSLFSLFSFLFFSFAARAEIQKEVLVFSEPCLFCDVLKEDMKSWIVPDNPDVKFTVLDMRNEENYKRFYKLAETHGIKSRTSFPVLFVGKDCITGWTPSDRELFRRCMAEFKNEKFSRLSSD